MMILGIFFEGVALSRFFSIQGESIFTRDIECDVLWFLKSGDGNELSETVGITLECSKRTPHFNFKVVQKLFGLLLEWGRWFLKEWGHI